MTTAALAAALAATGTAHAASSRDAQIKHRMHAFAAADTPAAACRTMSTPFRMHLGGGLPDKCATNMPAGLKKYIRTHKRGVRILKLSFSQGQGLVTARIGGGKATTYYFAHQANGWRLNSIGMPAPPPPA